MKTKLIVTLLFVAGGQLQAQNATGNAAQDASQNAASNTTPSMPRAGRQNAKQNRTGQKAGALDVPSEFQPGISSLQSAKSTLQQAGSAWGGHRVAAVRLIDKALRSCGQAQTASPAETKSATKAKDDPAALQAGITQLTNAKSEFQNVQIDWGGRRDKAISFMDQALTELQAANDSSGNNSARKRKAAAQ